MIDITSLGYCLPFLTKPATAKFFKNHGSARRHADFVQEETTKLTYSGSLLEVKESDLAVCSPLGVANNSNGKLRLILDLRFVNKHLRVHKFKYEDIRTACDLFIRGDWFFKFDYTSGFHHIDILPQPTKFLGCSWELDGHRRFFKFVVLPFGLPSVPFVFTKIQRALVSHW